MLDPERKRLLAQGLEQQQAPDVDVGLVLRAGNRLC